MLIPILLPWFSTQGERLTLREFIRSRTFSISYLLAITTIWFIFGFGHWGCHRCDTFGENLACNCAIWPNKMLTAPHEYFFSFFTSPFFHNDFEHLIFIIIGISIFCQSFEARAGSKSTFLIFFSSIGFTSIILGLLMNYGYLFSPENELFSDAMNRCWIGGSVGMMGVIGSLSHYSKKKWIIPLIIILFEIWNRYENGMNEYITLGHLTSAFFGFLMWGLILKNPED